MENLYAVLQCPEDATHEQLKQQFIKLARQHHPDKQHQQHPDKQHHQHQEQHQEQQQKHQEHQKQEQHQKQQEQHQKQQHQEQHQKQQEHQHQSHQHEEHQHQKQHVQHQKHQEHQHQRHQHEEHQHKGHQNQDQQHPDQQHPDHQHHQSPEHGKPAEASQLSHHMFAKISHAWKVLGDSELRKHFDVRWKDKCLAQDWPIQDTVDVEDFSPEEEDDSRVYVCRCGGTYSLTSQDVRLRFDVVCCDTCSLCIRVDYGSNDDSSGS